MIILQDIDLRNYSNVLPILALLYWNGIGDCFFASIAFGTVRDIIKAMTNLEIEHHK